MTHRPLLRPRLLHRLTTERLLTTTTWTQRCPPSSTPPPPSPAPSSTSQPSYGLFIDGEFVDGHRRHVLQDRSTRPPRRCSPRSPRPARPTSTPPSRPPARAYTRVWSQMRGARARQVPLPDRPDHPGARPRARRPRDDRQRQADQGVARRRHPARRGALLLLRRLGRQARLRRPRAATRAARRRRPDHPVELPAADAGVEDRPGAGLRQHRRAQAGRDHAADRAALRRDLPAGRPAARRRQHRHRRRRDRARRSSAHPDVDKVAFTGSTEVGKAIAARRRRHRQEG